MTSTDKNADMARELKKTKKALAELHKDFSIARALLSRTDDAQMEIIKGLYAKLEAERSKRLDGELQIAQLIRDKKALEKQEEESKQKLDNAAESVKDTMAKLEWAKKLKSEHQQKIKEVVDLQQRLDQAELEKGQLRTELANLQASAAAPSAGPPPVHIPVASTSTAPQPPAGMAPQPAAAVLQPPAAQANAADEAAAAAAAAEAQRAKRLFKMAAVQTVIDPLIASPHGNQIKRVAGMSHSFRVLKAKLDQGSITSKAALVKEMTKMVNVLKGGHKKKARDLLRGYYEDFDLMLGVDTRATALLADLICKGFGRFRLHESPTSMGQIDVMLIQQHRADVFLDEVNGQGG